jgi:anti-repressor protein
MDTDLQIFTNEQFGNVRTIIDGETVLFCGSDVAKSLGYSRPNEAVNAHCKGTVKRRTPTNGGEQEMSFVTEGDVYRLIIRSNLPDAVKFEKWLFEEVLPSIRKHGMYAKDELLDNPDLLLEVVTKLKHERDAKNALAVINRCLEESNNRLEEQVAIMEPKADTYDALMESPTTFDIGAVAKIINVGVGRNKLFDILREQKILRKNRNPFQYYVDLGWFKCAETEYLDSYGVTRVGIKTVVYQKGIDGILKLLKEKYGLVPKIVA